jgi:VWFA-related protein
MLIRAIILCFVIPATLVLCSNAQTPEERAFGWSLTVDARHKTKEDKRTVLPRAPQFDEDPSEIRIESSLVLSDVLVQDRNGVPVKGLQASDFEITEGGTRQRIDVFAFGSSAVPRSIFLVIDHSLSQWRHIDKTIDAAKTLVASLRPTDRMAIISDDVLMITDLTADKAYLNEKLELMRIKCGTGVFGQSRQYSALFAVLNEKIERNGTRNIVIFQTDGDEIATLGSSTSPFRLGDVIKVANRKGTTIYSVFTGSQLGEKNRSERIEATRRIMRAEYEAFYLLQNRRSPPRPFSASPEYLLSRANRIQTEEKAVAEVATASGGIAQSLDSADQAAAVYEKILADIGNRYLVGYYRPDDGEKGKMRAREVNISLRTPSGYRVIGGRTFVTY